MKEGKVWGETTLVFGNDHFSIHYLSIKGGGYCSQHRHHSKANIFFVISGRIRISQAKQGLIDETELGAGESMRVEPQIVHRFEALCDSRMIEIYESKLSPDDIERIDQGGLR